MSATGRYLLDTNVVIALMEGDEIVLSKLDGASEVFISAMVVGELFFGAAKSARSAENTARVERFVSGVSILSCDIHVARAYGRVKRLLREKGRPIPENDIWIAATARCHNLVLATRDRHFLEVEELVLAAW